MRLIAKGATSQSVYFDVLDSTSTTGGRKTGLAFDSIGLTAYYIRQGAAAVAITIASQTAAGAWTSGGFAEVSSSNAPGVYRLDVPDAAFAAGADSVVVVLKGATGMVQVSKEIQLAPANWNLMAIDGNGRVDVVKISGATQTARDIGASVLVSAGTGTGQLDITNGRIKADVAYYGGVAGTFTGGRPEVNSTHIAGTAWASADFGATMKASINAEADTAASDYGALKPTTAGRTLDVTTTGEAGIDWANIGSPTSTVNLSGTTVGTITTYTGNTPQTGDTYALANGSSGFVAIYGKVDTEIASIITTLGTPAGASIAADIAAIYGKVDTEVATIITTLGTPAGASVSADIATVTGYIDTEVAAIKAKTDSLTFTAAGKVDANLLAINGQTGGVAGLDRSTRAIAVGTVGTSASTTSIPTSALSPAASVANQFRGRIVIFDSGTITAALRGQATDITASSSGGTLTVTALTTAPASGDTFTIT